MHQINVSIHYQLYYEDEAEHDDASEQLELKIHQLLIALIHLLFYRYHKKILSYSFNISEIKLVSTVLFELTSFHLRVNLIF